MTDFLEQLAALAEKATRGDLGTAERHVESEWIECPWCQGGGEIEAADYCNFDSVAAGVQFYGIGSEFGAHEALWSHFIANLPAILAMGRERDALREALRMVELRADGYASNHISCHNCVDVNSIARQALEGGNQ